MEYNKCPYDGSKLDDVPEKDRAKVYHCRVNRGLKCLTEPDEDELDE